MSVANELAQVGIEQYLEQQQHKSLLKFLTCGSVDDGKSTLIGRLLHDSQQIYEDQLAALHKDSKTHGTTGETIDLALLVDGLQAEREQGITIDVAYRYFSTDKRKFIIADTPGHEQYTRNMATGASNCDLAIILVDARYGVQTQTRRHSFICSLLGIKQFVVAINKMDLLGFDQQRFEQIKQEYLQFAAQLNVPSIAFVPLSALNGDNVVHSSAQTPWYQDGPLLSLLEKAPVTGFNWQAEARLPVQYVSRPNLDFRGFAGTIASGSFKVGDAIVALPSGKGSTIKSIVTFDGEWQEAVAGQAVTITIKDEIDISRGDVLVPATHHAAVSNRILAKVVWMHEEPLLIGKSYNIKLATKKVSGKVTAIAHSIDVNTLAEHQADKLELNSIALVELELTEAVVFDPYAQNRDTGGFIFIDRISNITVGAGMVDSALASVSSKAEFSEFELELNALVRKHFPHWQALDLSQLKKRLSMSLEQYGVFAILAGLIALLTLTRLSAAWVFGAVAVLTYLTDLLNVQQFAASFTDSSLLTLVLLLLVSIALEKTRLISWVGQQLNNGGIRTVLTRLWLSTSLLSSFTANTAVVASLLGAIKRSQKYAPSKLMLPMAFAATFGGTLTLIGTSTNLVVNSFLDKAGLPLLEFFTTTAVGAGVVLSGMLMMWLIANRLPVTEKTVDEADLPYFLEARISADSVLIGKTIGEAGLRHLRKLFLAEIVRGEQNIAPVCPEDRLQQGDVLLFAGDMESVALLQEIQGLTLYGHHSMNGQALVEAIISHSSSLNGVSLKDAKFREEFDAVVVAVKRGQERLQGGLGSIVLQTGDTLLLVPGKTFQQNSKLSKEFLLVNGVDSATRLSLRRSWGVLSAFVAVIGLSMTGELPLLKGLVLLLIGLMATGIVSLQEIRRRFPLDIVLIVGGALVLSQAMENTGVSELLGQGLLQVFTGYHLFWALAALYFFTLILTELMSNNAAAALACPLAISLAKAFGIDPMPFIMAVLFGASASFISPWGYQTNLLVYTVGNYKLSQYVKVGLPMALAYSIAVLALIPLFFPFQSL